MKFSGGITIALVRNIGKDGKYVQSFTPFCQENFIDVKKQQFNSIGDLIKNQDTCVYLHSSCDPMKTKIEAFGKYYTLVSDKKTPNGYVPMKPTFSPPSNRQ